MNIDMAKKYTTRDEREVVIFEVSDKVYCKINYLGEWCIGYRQLDGRVFATHESSLDLVPVKAWRAWKEEEGPLRIMLRQKGITAVETKRTRDCDLKTLFLHYVRVHEDGTETPCGVLES